VILRHASVSIPAHLQSAIASVTEQMTDVSLPTHAGWSGGGELIGAEGGDTGVSGGGGVGGGIGDSISDRSTGTHCGGHAPSEGAFVTVGDASRQSPFLTMVLQ
jgi:hypothetical protein